MFQQFELLKKGTWRKRTGGCLRFALSKGRMKQQESVVGGAGSGKGGGSRWMMGGLRTLQVFSFLLLYPFVLLRPLLDIYGFHIILLSNQLHFYHMQFVINYSFFHLFFQISKTPNQIFLLLKHINLILSRKSILHEDRKILVQVLEGLVHDKIH